MAKLSKYLKKYASGGDWASTAADLVPYISNVFNATQKLPAVPKPVYEGTITPNLVNFNADRNELDRDLLGMNRGVEQVSSNPGIGNALKVANLSKFLEAKGRLTQTEGNLNSDIINNTKRFNSGILARNNERLNGYNQDVVSRKLAAQRLKSENLANATDKFQLQRRDKNLSALEQDKLEILKRKYQDTGVVDRNLLDIIQQNQGSLGKYVMGGKLKMKC